MLDRPLPPVLLAVLAAVFLDGDIGEVDKHVVHLGHIRRVELIAEPPEALVVQIGFDRTVRGHQHIDPQVKLLPPD